MTRLQQAEFVRDLILSTGKDLLEKVNQVPDSWDDIELRRWVADRFDQEAVTLPSRVPDTGNRNLL